MSNYPVFINVSVEHVNKAGMLAKTGHPYYGYTLMQQRLGMSGSELVYQRDVTVTLRNDLPRRVMISVKAHELFHANDPEFLDSTVIWLEIRANWAGFRSDWRGFFQGVWMSVTDLERTKLYWQRITQNF